jgi:hypothetical protein
MIWPIIRAFLLLLIIDTTTRCQTTFSTPDIKVIHCIKDDGDFTDECTTDLDATLRGQLDPQIVESLAEITAACIALDFSANVDPPTSFSSDVDWDNWRNTDEYRGYTHVPSFTVVCEGDTLTSFASPSDPQYVDTNNPTSNPNVVPSADQNRNPYGYTKVPVFAPNIYPPQILKNTYDVGDIYTPPYNGIQWSSNSSCLEVFDSRASRIANSERVLQFTSVLPGTDAPFVFRQVQTEICCASGCTSVQVRVSRSTFPTSALYIDGVQTSQIYQTGLGAFIASAGSVSAQANLSPVGNGVFAPEGDPHTWSSCAPIATNPPKL